MKSGFDLQRVISPDEGKFQTELRGTSHASVWRMRGQILIPGGEALEFDSVAGLVVSGDEFGIGSCDVRGSERW